MKMGFTLPWQVRYVRWWHVREARRHTIAAAAGCRYAAWHREQAADSIRVTRGMRAHYLATGSLPLTAVNEATALARMRREVAYPESPHAHAGDGAADERINARINAAFAVPTQGERHEHA